MTSELDRTYANVTQEPDDVTLKETEEFEKTLAEAVYEGLCWVSNTVAPVLDMCIQGATAVEIGLRKSRLNMDDCEEFEKGLEKVFGFGAKVIECRILEALHTKLRVSKEIKQGFKFSDEVRAARKLYKVKRCAGNLR